MNESQMVDELFEIYDKNQDGVISRGEFIELIDCLLDEKGAHVSSQLLARFDTNHDGVISKSELLAMIKEMQL